MKDTEKVLDVTFCVWWKKRDRDSSNSQHHHYCVTSHSIDDVKWLTSSFFTFFSFFFACLVHQTFLFQRV